MHSQNERDRSANFPSMDGMAREAATSISARISEAGGSLNCAPPRLRGTDGFDFHRREAGARAFAADWPGKIERRAGNEGGDVEV
ncbi:hypothetical protein M493_14540 [Geobacillus genomosp. 3]|uniref:Uncharacterized protein n=1 Tax=Geobacillus genomosp. 3 TaxID=1921421 RepID=S6A3I9_GEOG3|nr:hypothetical protein M493_14540 [Geobacillus genomosp. 3]